MSGWKDELGSLAEAGEQLTEPPTPEDVRRRVRSRKVARVAVPAGAAVLLLAVGAAVLPGLFRQPLEAASQPPALCGLPVLEAAAAAFGVDEAVGPGEGPAEVVAGANQVVEHGAGLAVGVGVLSGGSGAEELGLVPAGDVYVAAWLVEDGRVVGLLEPEHVISPSGTIEPGAEVWLDGSYLPTACAGGPGAVGEYSIVTAVALAPVLEGSVDEASATAVLSAPIPLRIGEPEALVGLGACGSAWPDGVAETTDGHALGLRITGDDLGSVVNAEAVRTAVTVTNESSDDLEGWTGHPQLVIVDAGTVVGGTDAMDGQGLDAGLAPGERLSYQGYAPLTACGSDELLPPGTYEVWAIMSFFFTSPAGQEGPEGDRTDVTAVGGPWAITID